MHEPHRTPIGSTLSILHDPPLAPGETFSVHTCLTLSPLHASYQSTFCPSQDGKLTRCFCQFIMDPIQQMHKAIMAGDDKYKTMCEKLGVPLKAADHALKDKALLKKVRKLLTFAAGLGRRSELVSGFTK